MREVTETIKLYKFSEASDELKDKIRDDFSSDIYEHHMDERIATLKELAELLNGRLDHSLSCVPDSGEFITITPNYGDLNFEALKGLDLENCPLTGVCYDCDVLENLNANNLQDILNNYIDCIHNEYNSMLQDDYLSNLCEVNEYEFTDDGKIY